MLEQTLIDILATLLMLDVSDEAAIEAVIDHAEHTLLRLGWTKDRINAAVDKAAAALQPPPDTEDPLDWDLAI